MFDGFLFRFEASQYCGFTLSGTSIDCRRPHLFLDMRIVDDNGKVMPHDGKAFGSLEVKGPIAMRQYFKVSRPPNGQLTSSLKCQAFQAN